MSVDQTSVVTGARRITWLRAALVLDVVAFALAVAALCGGSLSAIAPVVGTLLTSMALMLSLRSWSGAREVWSGHADPSRMRALALRSVLPSFPVLLVSVGVTIAVAVPSAARIFSSSTTVGTATWNDGALLVSLLLYLFASVGAALYPLRTGR